MQSQNTLMPASKLSPQRGSKLQRLAWFVAFGLLSSASALSPDSRADSLPSITLSLEHEGSALWTHFNGCQVRDNLLYAVCDHGLMILDIGMSEAPTVLSTLFLSGGWARGLCVAYPVVYVAGGPTGLCIVDVSDPKHPRLLGKSDTPGFASDVAVYRHYAYVALGDSGLAVIDASTPSQPRTVPSQVIRGDVTRLLVHGDYLFASVTESAVQIFALRDPCAPAKVGQTEFITIPGPLSVVDSILFVGVDNNHDKNAFLAFDITDPTQPRRLQTPPIWGELHDLVAIRNRVYLTRGLFNYQIRIFDTGNRDSIHQIGQLDSLMGARRLALDGNRVYIAGHDGIQVIDVEDSGAVSVAAAFNTPSWLSQVCLHGDQILVRDGNVQLYDLSRLGGSLYDSTIITSGWTGAICVQGDLLYTTSNDSLLSIYDLAHPGRAELLGQLHMPGDPQGGLAADSAVAYVGFVVSDSGFHLGMHIVDIRNPREPVLLGSVSCAADKILLRGHIAFVLGRFRGLQVVDAFDPSNPVVVAHHRVQHPTASVTFFEGMAMLGDRLFLGTPQLGLCEYDLSDPYRPLLLGCSRDSIGLVHDVAIYSGLALVACGSGLAVFDVRTNGPPRPVQTFSRFAAGELLITGDRMIAVGLGGVEVYRLAIRLDSTAISR